MCTHIDTHTSFFVSEDGTVAMFFLPCRREAESPPNARSLVAAGACDMNHLPPNKFTEAENGYLNLKEKTSFITGLSFLPPGLIN